MSRKTAVDFAVAEASSSRQRGRLDHAMGHARNVGIVIALVLSISCEQELGARPNETAKFLGALESFDSPAATQEKIGSQRQGWEVIERGELSASGRPSRPIVLSYVKVQPYEHLGATGELMLEFYGDWLSEVRFTPDDWGAYSRLLELEYPGILAEREKQPTSFTVIWIGDHYLFGSRVEKRYLGYRDSRLRNAIKSRSSP